VASTCDDGVAHPSVSVAWFWPMQSRGFTVPPIDWQHGKRSERKHLDGGLSLICSTWALRRGQGSGELSRDGSVRRHERYLDRDRSALLLREVLIQQVRQLNKHFRPPAAR